MLSIALHRGQPAAQPRRRRHAFRPCLEALEDRRVLSILAVTSTADNVNQPGTLRYAVAHAQGGDTILLTKAVRGGITLTEGDLVLSQNVIIKTADNHVIQISGDDNSRIFTVTSGTQVILDDLRLVHGNGVANNPLDTSNLDTNGGAILNFGTLTIDNSVLFDNFAADGGGAILNDLGTLTVDDSTLSSNATTGLNSVNGVGGAIWNFDGTLTVEGSTLSANSAAGGGAGILNEGTLTVDRSTLSDNVSGQEGGGIFNFATMTVSNSVLSRNIATFGAGAFNEGGTATVTGSTLADNTATLDGGALYNFENGSLSVGTSTFSGNSPDNIVGGFTDLGGNIGLP
jgi:hypothetical protein